MQVESGTAVLKTEVLRVAPDSLIGEMLIDAMSGQLRPYGQVENLPQVAAPTTPQSTALPMNTAAVQSAQPEQNNVATSPTLQQPSFDCSKIRSIPEYLICHDPELAASDRDLASIFQQAKDAVLDKTAFSERVRKQWNYREKNCRDKECLASWYTYQKKVLSKIVQTGDVSAN